jgi:predicted phosphate transport protein (TIGR00153 family)
MFNLIPREVRFFDLFERQSEHIITASKLLHDLVHNFSDARAKAHAIKEVEHQGDLVTHEIVKRLNTTFITPIDREDILALASGLDDVLDSAEAIGTRLVLFKIGHSTPEARHLTAILDQCGGQIDQAVERLRDMRNLMAFTIEINRLENEADVISRHAVADLFTGNHDMLDVLRWKEIYGRLENAADNCEDVANTIEAIVLKSR